MYIYIYIYIICIYSKSIIQFSFLQLHHQVIQAIFYSYCYYGILEYLERYRHHCNIIWLLDNVRTSPRLVDLYAVLYFLREIEEK